MVVVNSTLFPQMKALRQLHSIISHTAQQLNALNIASMRVDSQARPEPHNITPLVLPVPEEIFTPILKLNTTENLRDAIRTCFMTRIAELQVKCTTNYQQTCQLHPQATQPSRNRKLREAYLNLYYRQCQVLVETQLPYVMTEVAKRDHKQRHEPTKTEFNHEYTPILESYFAYNAYPSLPDRLLLARKSMMTARQIEVWFQNHRNRAKKDGLTLRRISPHTASTFAFDRAISLPSRMVASERSRSVTAETEPSGDIERREEVLCNEWRSPHAFPMPYNAKHAIINFSMDTKLFKHTSLHWMRSPADRAPRCSSMSVDDLTELFGRMNMLAAARPSRSSKSAEKQRKRVPPTATRPPPAPYPAIVNPSYTPSPLLVNIPDSCIWQKPSLRTRSPSKSRPQAAYPSWAMSGTSVRRRKSPSIPRRLPSTLFQVQPSDISIRSSSTTSFMSSSSLESRSTSMSSISSQTTVELQDVTTELSQSMLLGTLDPTLADIQWEFHAADEPQSFGSTLQQRGIPKVSQNLSFPTFTTMDLPGFNFFDS